MVLRAAVAAMLARQGAPVVPMASVSAGREQAGSAEAVGLFARTLVLRTDADGDPRFAELVRRVRQDDLAAYAGATSSAGPQDGSGQRPALTVGMENLPAEPWSLPGLDVEPLLPAHRNRGAAMTPLALTLRESRTEPTATGGGEPSGIEAVLWYATGVYERRTVQAFATNLRAVLEQVAAYPNVRVSRLRLPDSDSTPHHRTQEAMG
jgi:non-ribosomal peptide synthetase component F